MRQILTLVLVTLAAFAAAPLAEASGKKAPKSKVSFHVETEPGEGRNVIFEQMVAGEKKVFRIIPEITTSDIVAYRTFPSETGDFGIEFQLNDRARKRLYSLSSTHQNKWLVAQANGRVVDAVIIDRPVQDGRIVIWKGISPQEVKALEGTLPYIGETPAQFKQRKKSLR